MQKQYLIILLFSCMLSSSIFPSARREKTCRLCHEIMINQQNDITTRIHNFRTSDISSCCNIKMLPSVEIWEEYKKDQSYQAVYDADLVEQTLVINKIAENGHPLSDYSRLVAKRFLENENQITVETTEPVIELMQELRSIKYKSEKQNFDYFLKHVILQHRQIAPHLPANISFSNHNDAIYDFSPTRVIKMHQETLNATAMDRKIHLSSFISWIKKRSNMVSVHVVGNEIRRLDENDQLNPNRYNTFAQLPLIGAILANNQRAIELLMEIGADPTLIEPFSGLNALELIKILGRYQLRPLLLQDIEEEGE